MRLDRCLVERGMAQSRARAKKLIEDGQAQVNGRVCRKPAAEVADTDEILCGADLPFVGRGALKLEGLFVHYGLRVENCICLDVGASTGGFTDCLLRRGARQVYAVDVGHGQLAPALCADQRVVNLEGTDIRRLTPQQVPVPVDFCAIDVSFISLRQVLPFVLPFVAQDGLLGILIKPQFEAGRQAVGKGGIIKDHRVHQRVLTEMMVFFEELGLEAVDAPIESPILGGSGNLEYLACLRRRTEQAVPEP